MVRYGTILLDRWNTSCLELLGEYIFVLVFSGGLQVGLEAFENHGYIPSGTTSILNAYQNIPSDRTSILNACLKHPIRHNKYMKYALTTSTCNSSGGTRKHVFSLQRGRCLLVGQETRLLVPHDMSYCGAVTKYQVPGWV